MKMLLFVVLLVSGVSSYAKDFLNYKSVVNLADFQGTPYFVVMKDTIKPQLDAYAIEGFVVANSKTIKKQLNYVSAKVAAGSSGKLGQAGLFKFADKLNQTGAKITFYDLINEPTIKSDKYGISAFLALVSGGGVAVQVNEDVFAYNVNYGTGNVKDDEMTGRSFGAAGTFHKADDASDAAYLKALEKVARPAKQDKGKDISAFTRGILDIVVRSDASSFSKMSQAAQAVASDFVAVYTAEQDRHLMANLQSHHWDSALLEVSLLANFHAGQKKLTIMYESKPNVFVFTEKVPNQKKVTDPKPAVMRQAGMLDYWQFSKNPENPGRSGINITRKAFSMLEKKISDYEKANNPELIKNIESKLTGIKLNGNVFDEVMIS
ncbi:MAG: hypothetical protein ACOYL6_09335 [Bacteriovoracaceae bacterium]